MELSTQPTIHYIYTYIYIRVHTYIYIIFIAYINLYIYTHYCNQLQLTIESTAPSTKGIQRSWKRPIQFQFIRRSVAPQQRWKPVMNEVDDQPLTRHIGILLPQALRFDPFRPGLDVRAIVILIRHDHDGTSGH